MAREMDLINTDYPHVDDMNITEPWFTEWATGPLQSTAVKGIIDALTYRFQVQARLLLLAEHLMATNLLHVTALYEPMDLHNWTPSVEAVLEIFTCFPLMSELMQDFSADPGRLFFHAARWFATLIVRACANWPLILTHLIAFQPLGEVDKDSLDAMLKRRSKISFTVNPKGAIAKKEELSPACGFWLPRGTTILEFPCEDLRARYLSLRVVHSRLTGT